MISNLNQITRESSLRLRRIQNQFYLFDSKQCFEINLTGAMIVNAIGEDLSINDLCEKLAQKFEDVNIETIKKDVNIFLGFLIDEGLAALL